MAHVDEALPAPFHGVTDVPAISDLRERCPVCRGQFPIEPGRAIARHLVLEVEEGEGTDRKIPAPVASVIGSTLFGEVLGYLPAVGIDPLDDTGSPQRFQPAHIRADESIGIAIEALDARPCCVEVLARPVDAIVPGRQVLDVEIGARGSAFVDTGSKATMWPRLTSSSLLSSLVSTWWV